MTGFAESGRAGRWGEWTPARVIPSGARSRASRAIGGSDPQRQKSEATSAIMSQPNNESAKMSMVAARQSMRSGARTRRLWSLSSDCMP